MTKQYEVPQRTGYKNATHSYQYLFMQHNTITTKKEVNKGGFAISGAVRNNYNKSTCPNCQML